VYIVKIGKLIKTILYTTISELIELYIKMGESMRLCITIDKPIKLYI
jgi:hypothetical protein